MSDQKALTIAIDGYASTGKSSFAKNIARAMQYKYIDSGAMYRAATFFFLEKNLLTKINKDAEKLISWLDEINIIIDFDPQTMRTITYLNGRKVEKEIRSGEVSEHVSNVSKIRQVREKMVRLQQETGKDGAVVMDGRDIGTVVFPEAALKIFMTADLHVRAERRYRELKEKGIEMSFEAVKNNIQERDRIDETRDVSPLKKAPDAVVLDNTRMTPEEQMQWVLQIIRKKQNVNS
jgi:CMP/dCMP kinase